MLQAHFRLQRDTFTLDAAFEAPASGVTALFGPSGCGKTTLLRCIAGLERAPGRLQVQGEIWQDAQRFVPTHRRPLGYVFQEASLFPHLSVRANLEYGYRRIPAAARRIHVDQVVDWLGLAHLLARRTPASLSGGEQQRVAIGRALLVNPRLLLMDEPLAALDHARKQEILPYLERLRDELDIPLLYVSHSPEEVARLADFLVVLEQGRVVVSGALRDTLTRLDGPLAQFEDAGAVLHTQVAAHDPAYHLTRLDFAGGALWVSQQPLALGQTLRVRILARDVSLARHAHDDSSISNLLPARIVALSETGPDQVNVLLHCGEQPLLARITRRSRDHLALSPGMPVVAQVKSVALLST